MDDAADVHDHLVLGRDARNRRRLAGLFVFGQVDSRVDHVHAIFRHAFLFDDDLLDRLTQRDHRGGVAKDLSLQSLDTPRNDESAAQAVALDLVAQQRVNLVDHRPSIAPARERGSRRSAVMLGVHQLERMLAGDLLEPCTAQPGRGRNGVNRRVFEFACARCSIPTAAARGDAPPRRRRPAA